MAEPVLALERLYDAVVARFAAEGPVCPQFFGWRYVAQHHIGSRIVWVPGSPVGAMGRMAPARNPGGEPRSLATLLEAFHVVISGWDETEPENERLQYRATRMLHDYWVRAVHLAAYGTYTIETEEWLTEKLERRFGAAMRVLGTIQAAVLDAGPGGPDEVPAPADTAAVLDISELDVTEQITVEPL